MLAVNFLLLGAVLFSIGVFGVIARRNAVAAVPVAFFFGMLRAGGGFLAATGVPRYLVDIVQALLVHAALMPPILSAMWDRRQALRSARREAEQIEDVPVMSGAAA